MPYNEATLDAQLRALSEARDQALEALRLQSEYLAMISHEIRTPLSGIIGMIELLLETPLDPTQTEYVDVARDAAYALTTMLDGILDFTKIEAGKLALDRAETDVAEVVRAACRLLEPKARQKGLTLTLLLPPNLPDSLVGDSGRLRQVLLNLIGNAVKFTERGSITVAIFIHQQSPELVMLRIEVRDTGIGLSESGRRRLFQPFCQADGSISRRYGGTGLGLAISRRLIELMGGEIGVASEEGHGSTFWFHVPFPVGPAVGAGQPAVPSAGAARQGTPRPRPARVVSHGRNSLLLSRPVQ
jgi:signal transduction histidine kinase